MQENNLIYHYCGTKAFMGIVQSKELWASDITKLNDPSEKKLAFETIQNLAQVHDAMSEFRLFDEGVGGFYVCSFSGEADLLSQWRAYADDGEGFSLGFNRDDLKSIDKKATPSSSLNSAEQRSEIELREVFYDVTKLNDYYDKCLRMGLSGEFILGKIEAGKMLNEAQALLKAKFYSEEKEIRAFISYSEFHEISTIEKDLGRTISSRNTKYGLCLYTAIKIKSRSNTSLKHVVLGPKNVNTEIDIEKFLLHNGFDGVEVTRSAGQYR